MTADPVKSFYVGYHDDIQAKRHESPHWIRRFTHETIHERFVKDVRPGDLVLDAGCGDGLLSATLAAHGARVVGVDVSAPNVRVATARNAPKEPRPRWLVGDLEKLPFPDGTFDTVVSSHVIEHLPDPGAGLREMRRVTKGRAVIAMPTCFSPAAWALLGGDTYWKLSRRSAFAIPFGFIRTFLALVFGREGPQEGYAGDVEIPHVWRFPWVMLRMIREAGFEVERVEAGPLTVPYVAEYFPAFRAPQERMDRWHDRGVFRYLGVGMHVICRPR